MNASGLTLPHAVHLVAGAEYGTLTPHIRRLDNEMSWGVGFGEAIYRFGRGLGTPLADRSVDLIAKASKAGGDISLVLRAAADATFEVVSLGSEREKNMLIYVVIVLVSFGVFLFVIAILVSTFLTSMATAGAAASASGAQGFMRERSISTPINGYLPTPHCSRGSSPVSLPARWVKPGSLQG
jgi:flagellar protein FlaJ